MGERSSYGMCRGYGEDLTIGSFWGSEGSPRRRSGQGKADLESKRKRSRSRDHTKATLLFGRGEIKGIPNQGSSGKKFRNCGLRGR